MDPILIMLWALTLLVVAVVMSLVAVVVVGTVRALRKPYTPRVRSTRIMGSGRG